MKRFKRGPKQHQRSPQKAQNVGWQVQNIPDAQRGDQIIWSAPDGSNGTDATDITIWFPPDPYWDPLGIGTLTLRAGESVTKIVPKGARKDTYRYSLFCHSDGSIAEGSNSPPEMVIE